MALEDPRAGTSIGFSLYPRTESNVTLSNREKVLWGSIRHLCSQEVAKRVLQLTYGITSKTQREGMAKNIKLYIQQAEEFYQTAWLAGANTAPLLYYYSFLNLAKAVCEIRNPEFHTKNQNYVHGIGWKPSRNHSVRMRTESVTINTRGVWHVFLESVLGQRVTLQNPTNIRIADLFSVCPEVSAEFDKAFHRDSQLISVKPDVIVDFEAHQVWLSLSVEKDELRSCKMSRARFLSIVSLPSSPYREVKGGEDEYRFEFTDSITFDPTSDKSFHDYIVDEIRNLCLFTSLQDDELQYCVPIRMNLPVKLPQIVVLYSLMFWLSSLVRYDPQSVADLQESDYWILIDGYINQSRIWLLQLFEWELYQTEVTTVLA